MNTQHVLTLDDIPERSVVATFNDVHVPNHDERALRLAVECCEDVGVTHVVLNGDIHDCGVASRHPNKKAKDAIQWGTLPQSTRKGLWFYRWSATRPAYYLFGNHERWLEEAIAQDPAFAAADPMGLLGLDGLPVTVLPSNSRLRLGTFVWEHGHGIWPKGSGGQNPAARIKAVAPQQVTFVGHLHRNFRGWWNFPDDNGVDRVYGGMGNGHMSLVRSHEEYMGGYPPWQQSFSLHYVYVIDRRPRMTVDQIVILRDHKDRPYFEYRGKVYK